MRENGGRLRREWEELFARYAAEHPDLADQLNRMQRRTLPDGWDADLPEFPPDAEGRSPGRDSSGKVLNAVAARVPWLIGGSSDLAPSNKSRLTFEGAGDFSADDRAGRNLHFGVREHAAAAVCNGLALSKLRAYQAGFLIFSDFQRGALRLSALMELPLIHIYTHDSIGVGEDGPTHQPIEHLASIRAMPGVIDMRPGRRQRGRRGVAGDHADPARAGGADAVPPAAARPWTAAATPPRPASPAAPTSWPTRPRATPR